VVSCETSINGATISSPVPQFDFSHAGEWMSTEGEFGTISWWSGWNLPAGCVMPFITTDHCGSTQHSSCASRHSGSKSI